MIESRPLDGDEIRALYPELLLYAARWCRVCVITGDTAPEDLVQNAIAELCNGVCPADVPTAAFLKMQIKRGATDKRRHEVSFPKRSLDRRVRELPEPDNKQAEFRDISERLVNALMGLIEAAGDDELRRIVAAILDGNEKRADIAAAAQLSIPELRAAQKRLATLIRKLPKELVDDALELLGVS